MADSGNRLTEEEARRLWQRAAELQAEADRRREAEGGVGQGSSEQTLSAEEEDEGVGYSLTHVRQAALEVGIQPEVLGLALGEEAILELEGGPEEKRLDRLARRLLEDDRGALELRRSYPFPSKAVWFELERQLLEEPHTLEVLDIKGGKPEEGGVVVVESPTAHTEAASLPYWSTFADVKRFLIQILPEGEGGCSVLVWAPLRRSRRINGVVGSILSGGGSLVAGLLGMGIGMGIAGGGVAGLPLVLIFAGFMGGGAAGGGLLAGKGYRALYRYGLKRLLRTWDRILSKVHRDLEREMESRLPPPAS